MKTTRLCFFLNYRTKPTKKMENQLVQMEVEILAEIAISFLITRRKKGNQDSASDSLLKTTLNEQYNFL